ncbi:hypothetical protein [Nocardioides sp. SYSU DS0651]|uniref:hypothetical protein n=1 Tax=Nocardioides sp. SYSU DS0651 TaxID=3415955 RepID=UPI003F4B42D4
MRATIARLVAAVLLVATAGCSSEPADPPEDPDRIVLTPGADGEDHTHAPGQGHAASGPVGDGTSPTAGGFRMTDVRLPARPDRPGEVSFRIVDRSGAAVREYVEEQTKLLHLYVVRADLSEFRHLHPTLGEDGTWTARVDLGRPGPWRVVAELTPQGEDRPVVLGTTVRVPGEWEQAPAPQGEGADVGDDGVVRVRVAKAPEVGSDGRLELLVSSLDGDPLPLGSYLGASAHLTGFEIGGGGFVHVHPYGAPEQTDRGTLLTFHTTFEEPGDYRMFVQVRVEGLLHQVAVTTTVT